MGLGSKEQALKYVQDFYAGLIPEDVNWDAAIAAYQQQTQQTVGMQNLQTMFQQELLEAGLGPSNPLVAQSLGDPLGIAGNDAAVAFSEQFSAAMTALDFKGPAELAAQEVLAGWVNGIKTPADTTLKILSGLLWPMIEKGIKGMSDL